jgi:hypothetical protein
MPAESKARAIARSARSGRRSQPAHCPKSRHQQSEQQIVFEGLPRFVAVGSDALPAPTFPRPDVANHVVQRPQRAYPATEESSQEERRDEDRQAPQQPAIERVRGQRIRDGNQWVGLQKSAHRVRQAGTRHRQAGRSREIRSGREGPGRVRERGSATAGAAWAGSTHSGQSSGCARVVHYEARETSARLLGSPPASTPSIHF